MENTMRSAKKEKRKKKKKTTYAILACRPLEILAESFKMVVRVFSW